MGEIKAKKHCIIFGGFFDERNTAVRDIMTDSDYVICADNGYRYAQALNILPDLLIGDFDSYTGSLPAGCERIILPAHKDDTDLHVSASHALRRGFDDLVLIGVTGGRLDHTIAAICTLNMLQQHCKSAIIYDYNTKIHVVRDTVTLTRPAYDCYVSVFPIDGAADGVCISGAVYPLYNATLTNDYPLGVSNRFSAPELTISVKKGTLAVMIIRE